jgi:hypothetical protein
MDSIPDACRLPRFPFAFRFFRLAALLTLVLAAFGAAAQQPAPAPAADTDREAQVEALKELVAVLEDAGRREQLVAELRLLIEAQQAAEEEQSPAGEFIDELLRRMGRRIDAAGTRLREALDVALDVPRFAGQVRAGLMDAGTRLRWLDTAWKVVLVFVGGLLCRRLLYNVLRRRHRRSEEETPAARCAPIRSRASLRSR